ncbi:UbiA family prenyltransferase [Stenotrophobium rhamnosiphilum]|uniref:UbiA family prenyltransferase n=1 Tax=Stenotrophobium rhamnosiphilum TaxID=2029166 RepID=A0A2T5MHC7_9GAMM|nr:UbiA family prenyltransferase [Stenotrophobium rhamnosiphilum]PTU31986.1 UbiA family prenyltransferase [Stenotrophobium rhamnosiphilum]
MPTPNSKSSLVLAVDLDGSLIKTDLLWESATRYLASNPLRAFLLPGMLRSGRAQLKSTLVENTQLDVTTLPYRQDVLDWLRAEKAKGRRLVLATASDHRLATAISEHLGIFDEVLATNGTINLSGEAKREALVSRYGERGFDYVGNDHIDLKVWKSAQNAIIVSPPKGLAEKAAKIATVEHIFEDVKPNTFALWARALRLHQWLKNLLVFIPLAAAHRFSEIDLISQSLLAFIAFGLCASSVYLLNDLIDSQDDRQHRSKRNRPFASGDLSILHGWFAVPIPLLIAVAITLTSLSEHFALALLCYYGLTLAYTFKLKRVLLLDVVTLAGLYTLRIIAGAFAIGVPLSFWLLSFSMFIFMSIALIKRYTELLDARQRGVSTMLGRGYRPDDLQMVASLGAAAGYLSVLVLALYIQDPVSLTLYRSPQWIWGACPILLYWVSRSWMLAHRGQMHDDPMVFAFKDRVSLICGALFMLAFAMAR